MRRLRRMLLSAIGAGAAVCTVPAAKLLTGVLQQERLQPHYALR